MWTCCSCRQTFVWYSADCCDAQINWYFTADKSITVLPNGFTGRFGMVEVSDARCTRTYDGYAVPCLVGWQYQGVATY